MGKGSISVDTTSFDREFVKVVNETIPELAGQALYQQGFELIKYAIMEEPRCPHDTGRLWNSQTVEKPIVGISQIEVTVGFNVDYAAKVHEAPEGVRWKLEGAGPKYLETKLVRHKEELMKKTAEYIKSKQGAK